MLAHHYLAALELAERRALETEALVAPARAALREAGDRAPGAELVSAAGAFYDAALELVSTDDPERPYLLFRGEPANSAFRAADLDALGEAAAGFLAAAMWRCRRGRGVYRVRSRQRGLARGRRPLDRAFALVEDAPLSPQKVRVRPDRSRVRMWSGDNDLAASGGTGSSADGRRVGPR